MSVYRTIGPLVSKIFLRANLNGGKGKICTINNTLTMFCIRLTSGKLIFVVLSGKE